MKYDDASWHWGGDFPAGSPNEYGGTHIALFMRWCFSQGWAGQRHLDERPVDVQSVVDESMLATDFFFKYCDGKLTDEDFDDRGCEFANRYYGEDGFYLDDYANTFHSQMYLASEAEHDFSKLALVVARRYHSDILTHSEFLRAKPWWKFW